MQKSFKDMATRIINAKHDFLNNVKEQFGKTEQEAIKVFNVYRKLKVIKIDSGLGRYKLIHGAFWEQYPIDQAVKRG